MPPEPNRRHNGGKRPRLTNFVSRIAGEDAAELTGRQLRAARRMAAKRGIAAASDLDAVQQLKALARRGETTAPPPDPMPEPRQQFDMLREIEADLATRRRARLRRMLWRLALFVLAPGLLAAGYFAFVATPMYATYTEMVIQKPDSAGAAQGVGLLAALPSPTTQESASVQGFLSSRAAMLELMETQDFRAALNDPNIDPLQRLPTDAGTEQAYRRYAKRVRIGFDPNENIVRMEVIAPKPAQALRYANALIALAEEQVDRMSQRLRADRMAGAQDSYNAAEAQLARAQAKVLDLQQQRGVLNAELEASTQMAQIAALQDALLQKRLDLAQIGDNLRPNATRQDVLEKTVSRLEAMIADLRGDMTTGSDRSVSLARVGAELLAAQADLQLRRDMLAQSAQLLESARIEANRQTIYLATSVAPVLPDEAAYPKVLQNTLLAFLVLAGTYLLVSLTVSILREQINH